MFKLIFLAHNVCVSSDANADSILLLDLAIAQLVVELVGCGVKGVSTLLFFITVIIIKNGSLTNGHTYDRAAMLVSAPRAPVAVTALGSK